MPAPEPSDSARRADDAWLHALRRYLALSLPAHLVWEFAHMPLYTLWTEGTAGEIVFAAVHCTGGDLLIAIWTLVLALLIAGGDWPRGRAFLRVACLTLVFALGYTVFSEWLNTEIRESWAYSDLMPVVPPFGTGLSPLLQWLVIPSFAFWWASRPLSRTQRSLLRA